MRLNNLSFLLLLIFLWFNFSCSVISHNSGYDANPVFTPFHEKAGEIKASAGYGRVLGIQANASYSLSNHFALMGGGVYNHQTISTVGFFNPVYFKMKSHYAEGAIGYYFSLPGKVFTQVEIFAGLGTGVLHKKTDSDQDFSSYQEWRSKFKKPFLQISVRKSAADNLEVGFANRLSVVRFRALNYTAYADTARYRKIGTLITEPVLVVSYGKLLKATSQMGVAIPLTKALKTSSGTSFSNASILFQLGIKYTFR
ncbi:hypothetical protein [Adhaeribacter arboris]|uniref:hypothetical protein n=1 Tax=Adhaeribacter arboris TaxID=2072846 RepID=UPI001304D055|nr:hypothetical protein [Adhaeribacter arboris]